MKLLIIKQNEIIIYFSISFSLIALLVLDEHPRRVRADEETNWVLRCLGIERFINEY